MTLEWVRHFERNMSDLRVWVLIHLECTVYGQIKIQLRDTFPQLCPCIHLMSFYFKCSVYWSHRKSHVGLFGFYINFRVWIFIRLKYGGCQCFGDFAGSRSLFTSVRWIFSLGCHRERANSVPGIWSKTIWLFVQVELILVDDMLFTIISSNYHEPSLERYVLPGIVYEWSFAMSTVLLKIKFGTVVSQFMSKYGFIGIS
jgi:hypothetical protein